MERSGLYAVILAILMLLVGGWFAYDGYNKSDELAKGKLEQAKQDLVKAKKAADDLEKKVAQLSTTTGFTQLANWFNRDAFLAQWTKEIQGNNEIMARLKEHGVDTSKDKLTEGEIGLALALAVQSDDDAAAKKGQQWVVQAAGHVKDALGALLTDQLKHFESSTKDTMTEKQQNDLLAEKAAAAGKLATGSPPWANPKVLRYYLNSWGKRIADLKAQSAKSFDKNDPFPAAADKSKNVLDLNSLTAIADDQLETGKPTASLKSLLDALDLTIAAYDEKVKALEKARDDARASLHAIIGESDNEGKKVKAGSMSDEESKKDSAIKELLTQISTLRQQTADKIKDGETQIAGLNKDISEATGKLNAMVKDKGDHIKDLESKLADTKERLAKLQARQAAVVETTKADGQLLQVDLDHGTGWVDLGRANTLFRGTRFEIFRLLKAGKRQAIGEMEILELGQERSRVAITKVADPSDPPIAGDLVSNSAFDRKKAKVFSIAGQLRYKYSRDDIRRRLMEMGAQVSDDVTASTSILIVGDRYQEDPNWQRALEIGTPIMRERELYDALQIE